MARPQGLLVRSILIVIALLSCLLPGPVGAEPAVHTFDCKNCHIPSLSVEQLGGGNVCLSCHDKTLGVLLGDGSTGSTNNALNLIDASNASGSNPGAIAGKGQTSHNWGAPDTQPSAGANPPSRTLYPQFYSRFGSSQGKVTCSRCHNPHADRTNPQLLIMGQGSAQQMCLACHVTWNQGPGMSNLTHPVNIDYVTTAAAHSGKYAPAPPEDDGDLHTADQVSLFGGRILCGSCHQVHFADSDANTEDIPANFAALSSNGGDGFILRANGPKRTDKSGLCQTCHTYQAHGDTSGEKVGCMVCHGGHAAGSDLPNYYMLRKEADTSTFGNVIELDYSSSSVLDGGLKYTFWNDRTEGSANGYCEKCHGDAKTIGVGAGEYHTTTAVCTDCHSHGQTGGAFAASCNACHGMPPVAGTTGPGGLVGTPGPTGSASPGAHAAHAVTKQYSCGSCHANSVGSGPTHNDGAPQTVTIGFSLFNAAYRGGTYDGQTGVAYDASQADTTVTSNGTKTCANTYCHGNYSGSGKNATPAWDNPATGACGSCHGGSNSDVPVSGSHNMHAGGFKIACTACHNGIISGSSPGPYTVADQVKHADGKVDWAFNSADSRLQGGSERYNIASGTSSPSNGTTPRTYSTCENIYCHSNAQPSGGVGKPDSYATPAWGSTGLTCDSCHKGGVHGATGPLIDSGNHTTHLAYNFDSSNLSECTICHSFVSNSANIGCNNCHDIRNPGGSLADVFAKHVDGNVTLEFSTKFGPSITYSGTPQPGDGYGVCSNTYCHSTVQSGSDGTGPPVYGTPTWGADTDCAGCHSGGNHQGPYSSVGADGSLELSGSHTAHRAYCFDTAGTSWLTICASCHAWDASPSLNGCNRCHTPGNPQIYAKHVNGKIDIVFYPDFTGGIYNGSGVPRSGFSNCSNTYCHSNATSVATGTVPANTSPRWGSGPMTCDGCHGFPPAYSNGSPKANGHGSHNYGCNTCHYTTTSNGTTITATSAWGIPNHVDKIYTVSPGTGVTFIYSYNASGGTCTNISCHFNNSAKWGVDLGCDGCHGNPPATGAHLAHTDGTGAAYGSDSNLSTMTSQGFNCGNCHAMDGSKHGNGIVEIELYNAAATGFKQNNPAGAGQTGTGTATVCSNVYCHSSGQDASVRTYALTPQWGGTFTGNRCAGCHGDPPAYVNGGAGSTTANSHYASSLSAERPVEGGHLVGLHFDNIKKIPPDGPGGLYSKGGGAGSGAGHGDPATSTTISCPTCHAGTVSIAGQFSAPGSPAFGCNTSGCHTNPIAGSIANKSQHVNGVRDVQFMTGTFRTRAQLKPAADSAVWPDTEPEPGPFTTVVEPLGWTRNNGYKTANNAHDSAPFSGSYNPADKSCTTVCHLSQPATWGDTSKGCFACHADL